MTDIREDSNWKRPFFTIWVGQAFSIVGSILVQFALVWWLTRETGSATVLATATIFSMLPGIFIGPFSGALVDRWNRKTIMLVADSLIALVTAGLVLVFWLGQVQVWHVLVVMLIRALGGTFHFPAMQASTSLMVPEKHLSRVAGLNQALNGVLNIAAPPLGALLMSLLPIYQVLAIDILTATVAVGTLALIRIPQPERRPEGALTPRALLSDVRDGFRYLAHWPGMLILLGLATLVNLLMNPAFSLMPLMVTRIFHGEAMHLGVMNSAEGLGVILGGLVLSVWGGFKRKVHTSMAGLIGMGLGVIVLGSAPAQMFGVALLGIGIAGFMNPITNGPLFALLQAKIAPEMQGRVFNLVGALASAASPLGLMIAAPVADHLGIRFWFWIAGASCLLMAGVALSIPAVVHLEDQPAMKRTGMPSALPVQE
ncbi:MULTISPECIES: MFS transporter [Anaerolinea]|uniref:MFS transporter n=1 Tax=Anaerolinea TaxID=233189 RepID=UPI002633EC15|nr:MFS transporter [Anaerolinea thermophila]